MTTRRELYCMKCDELMPPSHVAVWLDGKLEGAVCGFHTVAELVLHNKPERDKGMRFVVEIKWRLDV